MSNVHELQRPEPRPLTFDDFWAAYPYPRRIDKALAQAKWNAITGDGLVTKMLDRDSGSYVSIELRATPEEIIAGLKRYDQRMRAANGWEYKDGGQFICRPATWLNRGRWMDD